MQTNSKSTDKHVSFLRTVSVPKLPGKQKSCWNMRILLLICLPEFPMFITKGLQCFDILIHHAIICFDCCTPRLWGCDTRNITSSYNFIKNSRISHVTTRSKDLNIINHYITIRARQKIGGYLLLWELNELFVCYLLKRLLNFVITQPRRVEHNSKPADYI